MLEYVGELFYDQSGYAVARKRGMCFKFIKILEIEYFLNEEMSEEFCKKYHCDTKWDLSENSDAQEDGNLIFITQKDAEFFIDNVLMPQIIAQKLITK